MATEHPVTPSTTNPKGTDGVTQIADAVVGKEPDNGYGTLPQPPVPSTPSMSGGATETGNSPGSSRPAPDAYPDIAS